MLVGRQAELGRLVEVAGEPPALVVVQGEAGVGKTRLVSELVDHPGLVERRVLLGHCRRLREPFPLGPVIEASAGALSEPPPVPLSAVVGALRPLLPELAAQLPRRPKPLGDPRAERHRVFRGLRELLGALGPTVCILEDLHWADEGTLEFLAFLVSEPPPGLSLVLTYRGEELSAAPSVAALACRVPTGTSKAVIELSALSDSDVQRLVSAILETGDVSEQFATWLRERTGGIPFAVEELLALVLEQGRRGLVGKSRPNEALQPLGVPLALRQLIIERMRPLKPDARRITYAAAVLGRPFGEDLVRDVAGVSAARAVRGLSQALASTLLQEKEPGVYGFHHALASQAVYEHIPGPERRQLHLRAAKALQRAPEPRPLDQLAHHFKQALRQRQWLHYAEAAADAASAVGDDRDAAGILEHALTDTNLPHATRVRMAIKLGTAALYGPASQRAIQLLEQATQTKTLPVAIRGELRFSLSRLRSHAGDTEWRAEMLRSVEELRLRPDLRARAMVNLAKPRLLGGDLNDHLSWLDRATRMSAGLVAHPVSPCPHASRVLPV